MENGLDLKRRCTHIVWLGLLVFLSLPIAAEPALLENLAQARRDLELGHPERALECLSTDSVEARVLKLEALCELREFTEAAHLLQELEAEEHGAFPAPYNFQFYLWRGYLEGKKMRFELALKNYEEALRRASTPDQRLLVSEFLTLLWLQLDETDKATAEYEKSQGLIRDCRSSWSVARHLRVSEVYHLRTGNTATAATFNRAAREYNLALGNPSRAAEALLDSWEYAPLAQHGAERWRVSREALQEYLDDGNFPRAADILTGFTSHYYENSKTTDNSSFLNPFEQAIEQMPEGLYRHRSLLKLAEFSTIIKRDSAEVLDIYESLEESTDPRIRCLTLLGRAFELRRQGQYKEALAMLRQALPLASPQLFADIDRKCSPAHVHLRMAEIAQLSHLYSVTEQQVELALTGEPGRDWAIWRIGARYRALVSAMGSHDRALAKKHLEAALADIPKLPTPWARAASFTNVLGALRINQSIEENVLNPADSLLGDYDEMAQELLREQFSEPARAAEFLDYFDAWQAVEEKRNDRVAIPMVLVYKAVFLDSLGRSSEAELLLRRAERLALEPGAEQALTLARWLLARIAVGQGKGAEAARLLTLAAENAEGRNPLSGRYGYLVAGSAQRDAGLLEESLNSYRRAAELDPELAWIAGYGMAQTYERMGRYREGELELSSALEQLKTKNRPASEAQLQQLRARLLFKQGRQSEALQQFARSHSKLLELSSINALYPATIDYAEALEEDGQKERALELCSETLDRLAGWEAVSYAKGRPLLESATRLALDLEQPEQALRFLRMARSSQLLEELEATSDEELPRQVSDLRSKLLTLRQRSGDVTNSRARASLGQMVAETEADFFAKLAQLRAREPEFESLVQISGSQLKAAQELLDPQTVLLEYFPSRKGLFLFVAGRDTLTIHQVNISRESLRERVLAFQTAVRRPGSSWQEAAEELHRVLLSPIEQRLAEYRNILVVPTDILWEVPFSALVDQEGRIVNEKFRVNYLTSTELLKAVTSAPSQTRADKILLVAGSERLPQARQEVSSLARLFEERLVMEPGDASAEKFLAEAPRFDLLHIATHGTAGWLELGRDRLPLDRVYGLKLKPSALVFLSACQSGSSLDRPGKEIRSLSSAFSVAGASTVIASRWKVDDRATRLLVEDFYRNLKSGKGRAESLRLSRNRVRKSFQHPYYWAAFSLMGDPR